MSGPVTHLRLGARLARICLIVAAAASLAACATANAGGGPLRPRPTPPVVTDPAPIVPGTMRPYQIRGRWYYPAHQPDYDEVGIASWYGDQFHGRPTATGEIFDMHQMTAAHTTLPLPSLVEVTNLETGQRIVVRVNDRGPFVDGRIIDLSRAAAEALGVRRQGLARVRVRYLGPAPRIGGGAVLQHAATPTPAPTPVQPTPARSDTSGQPALWWVQAGTFAERGNAEYLSRTLGRDRTRIDDVEVGGRRLYRVLYGPWPGERAAELARSELAGQGLFDALLVRLP